jgi:hypothetical protein
VDGISHRLPERLIFLVARDLWKKSRSDDPFAAVMAHDGAGTNRLTPMKTLATLMTAAVLAGTSNAGEATFYNDQTYPRFIRITHKGQKLIATWIIPGGRVTVNIDETRQGKPVLMVDSAGYWNSVSASYNSSGSSTPTYKFFTLPKKSTPLFFNMSWYGKRI